MKSKVFFSFSTGLANTVHVPVGTYKSMMAQIARTEESLAIEREEYNGEVRWNMWPLVKNHETISDRDYCEAAESHNVKVRWFYSVIEKYSGKPPGIGTEELTPEMASEFWLGLDEINVPPDRWTQDYYTLRMESAYECLRGRESEGMSIDSEPLTEKQAADVIDMFSQWLDSNDTRLSVKRGYDYLTADYVWCSGCGPVDDSDIDFDDECGEHAELCFECQEKAGIPIDADWEEVEETENMDGEI